MAIAATIVNYGVSGYEAVVAAGEWGDGGGGRLSGGVAACVGCSPDECCGGGGDACDKERRWVRSRSDAESWRGDRWFPCGSLMVVEHRSASCGLAGGDWRVKTQPSLDQAGNDDVRRVIPLLRTLL